MKGIKGIVNFTRQECRECEYEADSPHCGKCQVKAIESKIKEARAKALKEVWTWLTIVQNFKGSEILNGFRGEFLNE